MKKKPVVNTFIFTLIMVMLPAFLARAQSPFFQAVTNLNPVAYWPLQETIQPPSADVEANLGSLGAVGNAYYVSTNVVKGVQGISSGDGDPAVNFQNINGSFLAVPLTDSRVVLPAGAFTVEAWIYPTNTTASTIVAQTGPAGTGGLNGSANSAGWSLNLGYVPSLGLNMAGTVTFHVYNGVGSTGGAEATFTQPGFAINNWYHVVAVFDGVNAVLYVNGVMSSGSIPMTGTQALDTWDELTIGCGRGLNNNRFGGSLDEIAIYTNTLTAAQVQNHYNAGTSGSGTYYATVTGDKPYMYWRMDAAAYATPEASLYPAALNYGTGANINGLYLSGTTPGSAGPSLSGMGSPSYACAFNGLGTDSTNAIPTFTNGVPYATNTVVETGVIITNFLSSMNLVTNNMTFMAWFKENPSDSHRGVLLGHSDAGWRTSMSSGAVTANTGKGGDLGTSGIYNDGNWHFATIVYSNTFVHVNTTGWLATNYVYVDGTLIASAAVTNANGAGTYTNISIGVAPDHVFTGRGGVYDDQVLPGSIAHVAFFTNALSAVQIANLYVAAGGTPLPVITGNPISGRTNGVAGNNGSGPGSYIFFGVNTTTPATTYQWYFNTSPSYSGATALANGSKYSLATTAQVTVTNLADSDSGYYFAIVGNGYGYATSSLASFHVYNEPFITSQTPAGGSLQLYQNQNYTLSVTAAFGETNFVYQWFTNGVADTTLGTNSTYSLANVQTGMSGTTYQCVVANTAGSDTNALVTLTVLPLPAALTNNSYSSNLLALSPSGYWPMHEVAPAAPGDVETNLGSLHNLANGYYADWAQPAAARTNIYHQMAGAITNDSDTAVLFNNIPNAATPGYLVIPRTSPATTLQAPFTLEAWVKPINAGFGDIISQGPWGANANGTSGPRSGIRMGWASGGVSANLASDFVFFIGAGTTANPSYPASIGQVYPIGQWYHIVLETADNTNWTFYVNGQQHYSFTLPMAIDSGDPIVVGQGLWQNNGPQRGFPGAIDEVAIYTNALDPNEIQKHYNIGIGNDTSESYVQTVMETNPIVYLRMDGPAYTPPPASSWPEVVNYGSVGGNGVYSPGSLPGAVLGPVAAGIGLAQNVMPGNGMSSFADVGSNAAFNPVGSTPFSYGAWFRGNPTDARSFQTIMGRSDSSFRTAINAAGKLQAHAGANDITSPAVVNDGNWHQFIITYTGTNVTYNSTNTGTLGVSTLYLDGNQVGQSVGGANAGTTAVDMMIGDDPGNTNSPVGTGRDVQGQVCEAAFWNNVTLSSNQVQTLFNTAGFAPVITSQPISGSVNATAAFTNTVTAYGSNPLFYQWYHDGQPLPIGGQVNLPFGATNATLVLNPAATNDASTDYYVVVSNQFGAVTSSVVSLTVFGAPLFTSEPINFTHTNNILLFSNATPTFKVTTFGAQPLYYQWYTNGVPATASATNLANFTLPAVQLGGAGPTNFFCVASNFLGTATNNAVTVTGIPAPTAPYPVAVLNDHPINFWRLNEPESGGGDAGVISDDYWGGDNGIYTNTILAQPGTGYTTTEPSETPAQFGALQFQDCDAYGINGVDFGTPTNAIFSIEAWVNGYTQTKDAGIISKGYGSGGEQYILDTGSNGGSPTHAFRFFVRDASGAVHAANSSIAPVAGSWYHLVGVCNETNGAITLYINGAVAASASITPGSGLLSSSRSTIIGSRPSNATTNNNDSQFVGFVADVAVYNYALSSAQIDSHYTQAGVPPYFTQLPTATITTNGYAALTIPAGLVGTPPVTYQWLDVSANTNVASGSTNGANLNATLTIPSVPLGWNGDSLQLTVNNAYGSTNITVALTVLTNAPVLTVDIPTTVTVVSGRTYTYSPSVVGPQPYYYQWYANNTLLPATSATLPVVAGVSGSITNFFVVITNSFGAVTSSVSTFTAISSNSFAGVVLGFNPVGYWPLQETNRPAPATIETNYGKLGAFGNAYYAFTNDASGNQGGTVTLAQAGTTSDSDNAVTFTGNAKSFAFVPRANPALTLVPPMSLECWINSSSTAFSDILGESGAGLDAPVNGGNFGGIRLSYGGNDSGGPNLQFYVCNGNGSTRNSVATAANTLPLGQWHHCVATYDGTNTVLYIDGAASVTDNSALAGANTENPDTWTYFSMGGSFWQTNGGVMLPARSYNGALDEVAVYTNILTAAQVSAHFAAASSGNYPQTVTNDGALLYYRMDCRGYTNPPSSLYPIAVNYGSAPVSGLYPSGVIPGGISGPVISTVGSNVVAAPGNGMFSCVDAGTDPTFNVAGTNKFSAMVWVKAYPADPRVQTVMSHGVTNWAMNLDGTTGRIVWNTGSGGNVTSTTILNDGSWHFLVGVEDGRTNYLYVDGGLNASAALASTNGLASEAGAHVYLGGNQDFVAVNSNQRYLNGALAEAALFTNALTGAQVKQIYNATFSAGVPFILTNVVTPFLVMPGDSVSNSVVALGLAPLSYQWSFNGGNLTDNGHIIGSQTNVLAIANAMGSDAGNYQVIVTNSLGSATSSVAVLIVGSLPVGFGNTGPGWTVNQAGSFSSPAMTNGLLTLSDSSGSQARSFFFQYPQYIGAFKASFTYQAAGNKAADGITFCIQNDPRGSAALGGNGGGLGVSGIVPSAELELNVYTGGSNLSGFNWQTNGLTGASGANGGYITPGSVNLKSGDPIGVSLYYAGGQLSLTFTDAVASASFSTNFYVGDLTEVVSNITAYVGFTGSDGGSTSIQTITNFSFVSIPPMAVEFNGGTAAQVVWPGAVAGYHLQQNSDLTTTNWSNSTNAVVLTNGLNQATVPVNSNQLFYRLTLP